MIELFALLRFLLKVWLSIGQWVMLAELAYAYFNPRHEPYPGVSFPDCILLRLTDVLLWPRAVRRIKDRMDNDQNGRFNF
jgi:hypothetical protein